MRVPARRPIFCLAPESFLESKNDDAAILLPQAPKRRSPYWRGGCRVLARSCADLVVAGQKRAEATKDAWLTRPPRPHDYNGLRHGAPPSQTQTALEEHST